MMKARQLQILLVFMAMALSAASQDQQFTQSYALPTAMNPAFVGISADSKLCFQVRKQWLAVPGGFNAGNITFDQFFGSAKSGIGGMINYERAGSGSLRSTHIVGQYAFEARVNKNFYFRPALQFGYGSRSVDFTQLKFFDQILRDSDLSIEMVGLRPVNYFDIGAGFLAFGKKAWFGMSAYHLNWPNQSLFQGAEALLPMRANMQAGMRLKLKRNSSSRLDRYFVMASNFMYQDRFRQLDMGAYYELSPIVFGLWYRGIPFVKDKFEGPSRDALALIFGFQTAIYRIGYSYDITISSLGLSSSAGSHELTFTYQWANTTSKVKKRPRVVPCAQF
jgi:type IX secretion system PorP/SprF family membrane protein